MSSLDKEVVFRVAQLYDAISHSNDPNACIAKWILEQGKNVIDVNWKIAPHYLPYSVEFKLQVYSECSMLYVAHTNKNIGHFQLLLDHGADFTVKNEDVEEFSILHHIFVDLEENGKDIDKWIPLEEPFINMILSAHVQFENSDNSCDITGLSHFHLASMANHVDAVKLFLNSGILIDHNVDMNATSYPGYNALHFTAEFNSHETAKILISNGANAHVKNAGGMTPLYILIKERLEMFDSEHAAEDNEFRVTIQKKKDLNEQLINLLLENDTSSCDTTDDMGLSNFHVSCILQDSSVAECLADQVVDINHAVKPDSPIFPGYIGLHFAGHCNVETVMMLIKKGADLLMKDLKFVTPLDICMRWFSIVDIHSAIALVPTWNEILFSDGKTKLVDCILAMKNPSSLKELLQNCNDVNTSLPSDSPLWSGSTPLHLAVRFSERFKVENEEAEALVKVCIEQDVNIHTQDKQGSTALHLAFRQGKRRVMDYLFGILRRTSKKTVNLSDEDGLTYLHISGANKTDRTCSFTRTLLPLKRGVNSAVNATYEGRSLATVKSGWTPMHVAAKYRNMAVMNLLVSRGAEFLKTDSQGFTAVHTLFGADATEIDAHNLSMMKTLEERVVDSIGLTHLHVASWFNLAGTVRDLLEKGSDIEAVIQNEKQVWRLAGKFNGCRPLHVAMMNNSQEAVKELLQWGADIFSTEYDQQTSPLSEALNGRAEIIDLLENLLENNVELQKSMEMKSGLTMLHIACHRGNLKKVKSLLKKGVNVNAKVHDHFYMWRSRTPLHVLLMVSGDFWFDDERRKGTRAILDLLLENGADLFLMDDKQRTPLLLLFEQFHELSDRETDYVHSVLKHHRDFSNNPSDNVGHSCFHLACLTKNLRAVEQFLQQGCVDVNQPIDFFARAYAGCTPLHLAVKHFSPFYDDNYDYNNAYYDNVLHIVDLLLNHGAKVDEQNSSGFIPLHFVLYEHMTAGNNRRFMLIEKLLRFSNETVVNMRTTAGQTPLEYFLSQSHARVDEVKLLLNHGARMNMCNPVDGRGCIAILYGSEYSKDEIREISEVILKSGELLKLDEMGRNAIHNTVSAHDTSYDADEDDYLAFIAELIKLGCDIDHQDIFGKTALHLAAEFKSRNAIYALLMSGADFNILDTSKKPALSYICDRDMYWIGFNKADHADENVVNEDIMGFFDLYVEMLKLSRIQVSECNDRLREMAIRNSMRRYNFHIVQRDLINRLKMTESVKVDEGNLSLRSFLCETGAISVYPAMTPTRRDEIAVFFENINLYNFENAAYIIKLQYRKAVARLSLVDPAGQSLQTLLNFPLPYLCLQNILLYLSNSDLKNLMAASMYEEDMVIDS